MFEVNAKPYTIRLFVPSGNPNSFKRIDKMNWTGIGLEIARDSFDQYKNREELEQAGIYLLIGHDEETDLPLLYIGQADGIRRRLDNHIKHKLFWDRVLVFVSSNGGLNRAHITWLEWALITRAIDIGRCKLDNGAVPNEPILVEYEKADTQQFLNEILSILPIVDVKVFDKGKKINVSKENNPVKGVKEHVKDTVVVPAQEDGFQKVFLNENSWYAIRIGGGKLNEIKYIAAYQTAPVSAITHYAEVESIEAYGDGGKYKLNFKNPAQSIKPIPLGNAKKGAMQSHRYTSFEKLLKAKDVKQVFNK